MNRTTAIACAVSFGFVVCACSGEDPDPPVISMDVESPGDGSCIGVSGFEIDVTVGDSEPRTSFLDRTRPVLARDECVLDRATAFGDIDLDEAVRVEVRGYDGARQLRVRGVSSVVSLRDRETLSLQLEPAGVSSQPVVVIDRSRDLLSGNPLDSVESLELAIPGQSQLVVTVDEETLPYFLTGEPWAVAYPGSLSEGSELSAKVTLVPTGVLTARLTVQPSENGEYLIATQ